MSADRLEAVLQNLPRLAIAVSGGVDSMTLAHAAKRFGTSERLVVHAVSPAVPAAATRLVKDHAARSDWNLTLVDAGEFADARYRANPVNRCYFCKTNLYDRIRQATDWPIASGTNTDDLSDYRPGLQAAAEREVIHPFVLAGMDKAAIRALARAWALDDLAELPAQPCLSSRVETGIAIDAEDLAFVEAMELRLAPLVPPGDTVRCRVTHAGVMIELGVDVTGQADIATVAAAFCAARNRQYLGVRPYRRGAAFLRNAG